MFGSPSAIITMGLGLWGSPGLIVTLGYGTFGTLPGTIGWLYVASPFSKALVASPLSKAHVESPENKGQSVATGQQ